MSREELLFWTLFWLALLGAAWVLFLVWLSTTDQALFWTFSVLTALYIAYLLFQSIFFPRADEGLEAFLFNTHWATYMSNAFLASLDKTRDKREHKLCEKLEIRGRNIVFLLWPVFRVYQFPTTGNKVILHAGDIFTRSSGSSRDRDRGEEKIEESTTPRVLLQADPTITVRFLTLRKFIPVYHVKERNLTERLRIGTDADHMYTDGYLAKIIMDQDQELVLEALRKAASHFTWEGDADIINQKPRLEIAFLYVLAEHGSQMELAHMLKRPHGYQDKDKKWHQVKQDRAGNWHPVGRGEPDVPQDAVCREMPIEACIDTNSIIPASFWDESVISFDGIIEKLRFAELPEGASDAAKVINDPLIARLRKTATIRDGEARARAVQLLKEKLKIDGEDAAVYEVLSKNPELKLNLFGQSLTDAVQAFTKK